MKNLKFTRRSVLKGGTALAGLAALESTRLLAFASAWAQSAKFKPEKGAKIQLLRWKRFVQAEDDAFRAIVASFTKTTGCEVTILEEGLDDVQPKASVAANTGRGPDMFWGIYSMPQLFPDKALDMSDLAAHLGKTHGGWVSLAETYGKAKGKWICIPVCISGNYINYRRSSIEKAGFKEVPSDLGGYLELMKALKKNNTPGGFALGHASGDANAWTHWLLWAHGGAMVDEKDKVILDSPETAKALEYCKLLYDTFIPGTASWNDAFNNKAFLSGELHLTNNGISIYAAALRDAAKDAKLKEIADDMDHAYYPIGPVGKPTEFQVAFPVMGMKYTKFPNACKSLLEYWMAAEQYNKWLSDSIGYMTHTLNAYDANPVWTLIAKARVFRDATKRSLAAGYRGSIGERAAAALADFIIVDMFANVATGRETVAGAVKIAERQARRLYR